MRRCPGGVPGLGRGLGGALDPRVRPGRDVARPGHRRPGARSAGAGAGHAAGRSRRRRTARRARLVVRRACPPGWRGTRPGADPHRGARRRTSGGRQRRRGGRRLACPEASGRADVPHRAATRGPRRARLRRRESSPRSERCGTSSASSPSPAARPPSRRCSRAGIVPLRASGLVCWSVAGIPVCPRRRPSGHERPATFDWRRLAGARRRRRTLQALSERHRRAPRRAQPSGPRRAHGFDVPLQDAADVRRAGRRGARPDRLSSDDGHRRARASSAS